MLGSLYYQYAGDPIANISHWLLFAAWYTPCILCRWARILMYPIVLLSAIGIWKKDISIVNYILPMSIGGIWLEIYHYMLQKTDRLSVDTFCTKAAPCSALQVDYFGFITIPFLCLLAFIVICVGCIIVKKLWWKSADLHYSNQ